MTTRTVEDLTFEELGELLKATIEVLNYARLMNWQEAEPEADGCIGHLVTILNQIGLPQPTEQEYDIEIRRVLATRPEDFVAELKAKGIIETIRKR